MDALTSQSLSNLREEEKEIQNKLAQNLPVKDGQLDFSEYDHLMKRLRFIHAEMSTIING